MKHKTFLTSFSIDAIMLGGQWWGRAGGRLTIIMLWVLQRHGELCHQITVLFHSTWLTAIMLWILQINGKLCHQNDSIIQLNMVERNNAESTAGTW